MEGGARKGGAREGGGLGDCEPLGGLRPTGGVLEGSTGFTLDIVTGAKTSGPHIFPTYIFWVKGVLLITWVELVRSKYCRQNSQREGFDDKTNI